MSAVKGSLTLGTASYRWSREVCGAAGGVADLGEGWAEQMGQFG